MHMISCLGAGSSAILLLSDCLVAKIFLHIHLDFERCMMPAIVHLDSVSITVHTPFPSLSHTLLRFQCQPAANKSLNLALNANTEDFLEDSRIQSLFTASSSSNRWYTGPSKLVIVALPGEHGSHTDLQSGEAPRTRLEERGGPGVRNDGTCQGPHQTKTGCGQHFQDKQLHLLEDTVRKEATAGTTQLRARTTEPKSLPTHAATTELQQYAVSHCSSTPG